MAPLPTSVGRLCPQTLVLRKISRSTNRRRAPLLPTLVYENIARYKPVSGAATHKTGFAEDIALPTIVGRLISQYWF